MIVAKSVLDLRSHLQESTKSIGFIPTMGALHEGHIALIKEAKKQNDLVVVSIFVNPTQFLAGEDFELYPRKDEADKEICRFVGVDLLFMPQVNEIYSQDECFIEAPKMRGYILEGHSRAGHFSGVLTVVLKLLNIVKPSRAYFGKKDAQQLYLITQMCKSLFLDVEIVPCEIVRGKDTLALSSRNAYLSKDERTEALKIPRSLMVATNLVKNGTLDCKIIEEKMRETLKPLEVEYAVVVDRNLNKLEQVKIGNSIILVEAKVGTTRLLDNIWI
ncbi:MAG: pantoate--beta-alanine ligase [Sulfuricurvum sp.]